jgi:hypothetical protein
MKLRFEYVKESRLGIDIAFNKPVVTVLTLPRIVEFEGTLEQFDKVMSYAYIIPKVEKQ